MNSFKSVFSLILLKRSEVIWVQGRTSRCIWNFPLQWTWGLESVSGVMQRVSASHFYQLFLCINIFCRHSSFAWWPFKTNGFKKRIYVYLYVGMNLKNVSKGIKLWKIIVVVVVVVVVINYPSNSKLHNLSKTCCLASPFFSLFFFPFLLFFHCDRSARFCFVFPSASGRPHVVANESAALCHLPAPRTVYRGAIGQPNWRLWKLAHEPLACSSVPRIKVRSWREGRRERVSAGGREREQVTWPLTAARSTALELLLLSLFFCIIAGPAFNLWTLLVGIPF